MLGLTNELKEIINTYRLRTEGELGELEIVKDPLGGTNAVHVNLTDKRGEIEPERLFTLVYPGITVQNADAVARALLTAVRAYLFEPSFTMAKKQEGDKPEMDRLIPLWNSTIADMTDHVNSIETELRTLVRRALNHYDLFLQGTPVNPDFTGIAARLNVSAASYRSLRDVAHWINKEMTRSRATPDLEWVANLGRWYKASVPNVDQAWQRAVDEHAAIKTAAADPDDLTFATVRGAFDTGHSGNTK